MKTNCLHFRPRRLVYHILFLLGMSEFLFLLVVYVSSYSEQYQQNVQQGSKAMASLGVNPQATVIRNSNLIAKSHDRRPKHWVSEPEKYPESPEVYVMYSDSQENGEDIHRTQGKYNYSGFLKEETINNAIEDLPQSSQHRGWEYVVDARPLPDLGSCWGEEDLLTPPSPSALRETFTWQPVKQHPDPPAPVKYRPGSSPATYIYSAYYEPRLVPPAVRIIGISSGKDPERKYCQVWYPGRDTPQITRAESDLVPETHDKMFAAVMYLCYLKEKTSVPIAVSLVFSKCQQPSNLLRVAWDKPAWESRQHNFTVCISPLNNNYNNTRQLVETLEVNIMFGADKLVVYNHSGDASLLPYLHSYVADGLVEIIPWDLPVHVDSWPPDPMHPPQIHYFGQLAMLNECLYRYMYRTCFIVVSDLDEVVVPRMSHYDVTPRHRGQSSYDVTSHDNVTWYDVIKREPRPPAYGGYIIQNAFFLSSWRDDPRSGSDPVVRDLDLQTLLKTQRQLVPLPWYNRSKYIVIPRLVEVLGVHFVHHYVDDVVTQSHEVSPQIALLHHYRRDMELPAALPKIRDYTLHGYYREIVARTRRRHERAKTM